MVTRHRSLACCLVVACGSVFSAARGEETPHPRVKFSTTLGDFVLELDRVKAPATTENMLQYVRDGFYDGTIFHRVKAGFVIQGGGFLPDNSEKKKGLRPPVKNEWNNGLTNVVGTVAMARTAEPDSATSQFFINLVDNTRLDQPMSGGAGYAVFGKVVEGMDTVTKIAQVETTKNDKMPADGATKPVTPVVIKSARIVEPEEAPKSAP